MGLLGCLIAVWCSGVNAAVFLQAYLWALVTLGGYRVIAGDFTEILEQVVRFLLCR